MIANNSSSASCLGSHASAPLATANKLKVLIVEDHDDSRQMLRVLLEMKSCDVLEACNGVEAVEIASREQPQLILMDGSLPIMDGLEATRRIRENVLLQEVTILALNGWGTPSFHASALAAGCNDCIAKPIDFEQLDRFIAPLFDAPVLATV